MRADYGAASNDRVHKSFFYGSKHIDQYVPKVSADPRMGLTMSKQTEWAGQQLPAVPANPGMYMTSSLAGSLAYKGVKDTVPA